MKHLTKIGRTSKLIQRKYVRIGEASINTNIHEKIAERKKKEVMLQG